MQPITNLIKYWILELWRNFGILELRWFTTRSIYMNKFARLCSCNESSSPAHLLAIRGNRRVFKKMLWRRGWWKQCTLPATAVAIWQIMPSAHDVPLQLCSSCAQVHELQRSHWRDNREATLFSWLHIYYACLAPVTFKQCVSWNTYDHLCNIYTHRQVWE